jgi:hypothetical protein
LRIAACVAVQISACGIYLNLYSRRKLIMRKFIGPRALVAATFIACVATLAPGMAQAREGAQSVGQGIKCYTGSVLQADGTYKLQRICYKGV